MAFVVVSSVTVMTAVGADQVSAPDPPDVSTWPLVPALKNDVVLLADW